MSNVGLKVRKVINFIWVKHAWFIRLDDNDTLM